MKIKFNNCDSQQKGIEILKSELGYDTVIENEDILISHISSDEDILKVYINGKNIEIMCKENARFFRGLTLALKAVSEGKTEYCIEEKPNFVTNGPMFDVSRNSVLRPEIIKRLMNKCAMMGLNMFMLYTEDTYEVKEYPYFGHMRGRYSKAEINEMDKYAKSLGIELIPCIQCLSHLGTALQWSYASSIKDVYDTLLIGEEQTYEFIDKLLKATAEMFTSRRVHIGLDEAFFIGCGEYVEKNHKFTAKIELMLYHVNRVNELCKKYGLKPMMWSDTLFTATESLEAGNIDEAVSDIVKNGVPKDMQQVAWAYTLDDEDKYIKYIRNHDGLCDNLVFCGAIFTYLSYFTSYKQTMDNMCCLNAAIKCGVKEVIASIWHNESSSSLVSSLYGLVLYAQYDYNGGLNEAEDKALFEFICRTKADDVIDTEMADDISDTGVPSNTSRFLMFNDPLIGLIDKHLEGVDAQKFYGEVKKKFAKRSSCDLLFEPMFKLCDAVVDALELKADFGVRLKKTYIAKDTSEMKKLREISLEISRRLEKLKEAHLENWLYYNKAFGFEIHDMYYGSIISRLVTLRYHIDKWLSDNTYVIEELEEDRLYLWNVPDGTHPLANNSFYRFGRYYSANVYAIRYRAHLFG